MQDNQLQETTQKTMRLENELIGKIEKLAKENQRDFTKQVKYMLYKYLELIEKK